ncbi:predicted protein [Streptomyces viridochromogenes DSM 40736]|uniref:Predicted protein n=2 Tax=Streptomyces TaxID=1883 RepID=D9X1C1_STRVT|nr:predicted protein [Streptomyces viridochromogenes DSM 40736]
MFALGPTSAGAGEAPPAPVAVSSQLVHLPSMSAKVDRGRPPAGRSHRDGRPAMPRRPLNRRERLTLMGILLGSLVSAVAGAATSETFKVLLS